MKPYRHANSGTDVSKTENPKAFCISVDQEVMLRIIFKLIDVDNSGDLSRSEIIKAMRKDPNIGTVLNLLSVAYYIAALFGLPQTFAQESDARKKFEELFQTLDTGWILHCVDSLFYFLDGSKSISLEEFCRIGMKVNELVPEDQRTVLYLENTWQPNPYMAVGISFAAGVVFALAAYKYITDWSCKSYALLYLCY